MVITNYQQLSVGPGVPGKASVSCLISNICRVPTDIVGKINQGNHKLQTTATVTGCPEEREHLMPYL